MKLLMKAIVFLVSFTIPPISLGSIFHKSFEEFCCVQISQFFKDQETGSGKMGLKQALETVQTHVEWTNKFEKNVADWLNANV